METIEERVLDDGNGPPTRRDRALLQARARRPALPHRASPAVAYLLLLIGLALLVFEFFTAGVGIAGVVGAGRASCWPAPAWPRCRPGAGRSR